MKTCLLNCITSKICDGIFCDILSEIRRHHVTSLLIGWHLVLRSSHHMSLCANSTFFSTETKMNKCIRMGIIAFKFVIWGGRLIGGLRSEISFYGDTRRRKTKFPTLKPPIYAPKWQISMQLSLNSMRFTYQSNLHDACSGKAHEIPIKHESDRKMDVFILPPLAVVSYI